MKSSGKEEPKIIYCDNHLLVAWKPSGYLTQPDETHNPSLEDFCKQWVKKEYDKPGNVFLHCIHRLDRPVSGLVLFARTSKALSRLNQMSREQKIHRTYTAEVEGRMAGSEGTLEHYLIHEEHRAIIGKAGDSGAKRAVLHYRVLEQKSRSAIVSIELETGRYHQIRAQFSGIGHPIVGDARYGAQPNRDGAIQLECTNLSFTHPVTQEIISLRI